jgi:hypothetical protein
LIFKKDAEANCHINLRNNPLFIATPPAESQKFKFSQNFSIIIFFATRDKVMFFQRV